MKERIPHSHAVKVTVQLHAHVASLSPDDVALGSARIGNAIMALRNEGFDVEAGAAVLTKRPKMADKPNKEGGGTDYLGAYTLNAAGEKVYDVPPGQRRAKAAG